MIQFDSNEAKCSIVVIQGDQGSGKSCLLHLLLQEFGSTATYLDISEFSVPTQSSSSRHQLDSKLLRWFHSGRSNRKTVFLIDNLDNPENHFTQSRDRHSSDISYLLLYLRDEVNHSCMPVSEEDNPLNMSDDNQQYSLEKKLSCNHNIMIFATCSNLTNLDPALLFPFNAIIVKIHKPNESQRTNMLSQLISLTNSNKFSSVSNTTTFHENQSNALIDNDKMKILISQTQGYSISEFISLLKDAYTGFTIDLRQEHQCSLHQQQQQQQRESPPQQSNGLCADFELEHEHEQEIQPSSSSSSLMQSSSSSLISIESYLVEALNNSKATKSIDTSSPSSSNDNNRANSITAPEEEETLVGMEDIMERINHLLYGADLQLFNSSVTDCNDNNHPITSSSSSPSIPSSSSSSMKDQYLDHISGLELPCPSGIVIHGPAGSGKSSLAQWIAHSGRHRYQCISLACTDLVHKIVGESEQRLVKVFAEARERAPCLLILDNLDIILGQSPTTNGINDDDDDDDNDDNNNATPLDDDDDDSVDSEWVDYHEDNDVNDDDDDDESFKATSSTHHRHRSSTRTSHVAIDRLLSTLLVEIDGLKLPSTAGRGGFSSSCNSSGGDDNDISPAYSRGIITSSSLPMATVKGSAPVIVIATVTDMKYLDRSLLRSGRLEEHIELRLPTHSQRIALFLQVLSAYAIPATASSDSTAEIKDVVIRNEDHKMRHTSTSTTITTSTSTTGTTTMPTTTSATATTATIKGSYGESEEFEGIVASTDFEGYLSQLADATTNRSYAELKSMVREAAMSVLREYIQLQSVTSTATSIHLSQQQQQDIDSLKTKYSERLYYHLLTSCRSL